jgi:hypothetical protein
LKVGWHPYAEAVPAQQVDGGRGGRGSSVRESNHPKFIEIHTMTSVKLSKSWGREKKTIAASLIDGARFVRRNKESAAGHAAAKRCSASAPRQVDAEANLRSTS